MGHTYHRVNQTKREREGIDSRKEQREKDNRRATKHKRQAYEIQGEDDEFELSTRSDN